MPPFVPIVKGADNADYFRVRRPHYEAHAPHALTLHKVRAHGAIALVLRPLAVNVQVKIRDQTREAVRIFDVGVRAAPQREMQLVAAWIAGTRGDEESLRARLPHGKRGAMHHHRGVHGLRKERAYLPAIGSLMRP